MTVVLSFSVAAIALAASSPMLLLLRSRCVTVVLCLSTSAIAVHPASPTRLSSRSRCVIVVLCLSASATWAAPHSPRLTQCSLLPTAAVDPRSTRTTLARSCSNWKRMSDSVLLEMSDDNSALPPSSPMLLLMRLRCVTDVLCLRACAIALPPSLPILLLLR